MFSIWYVLGDDDDDDDDDGEECGGRALVAVSSSPLVLFCLASARALFTCLTSIVDGRTPGERVLLGPSPVFAKPELL